MNTSSQRDDWVYAPYALDTYYLRSERLYRALYDCVRMSEAIDPFFMGATSQNFVAQVPTEIASWSKTAQRLTLSAFYGLLIASTVLVIAIICVD